MAIFIPSITGGFDFELLKTPPDRVVCKICYLPNRDPYLSVCCGHVFCKSCLDNVKSAAITKVCPICCDKKFVTFPNKQLDREIRSLHIYCTNKEKGCEWQGELNDINNHLGNRDGCQFEEVKCSNECGEMIQRQYLTSHVETECPRCKVNCQYCHDTGEHQFIEGQHKEECPKLPLSCPNKCEVGSVSREDMEAHRKECPLEMIQCEYYSVGCEVRMARMDQEEHMKEKIEEHLTMIKHNLTGKLTDTNTRLFDTERKLVDTSNKLANAGLKLTISYVKLANTERKLTDTSNQLAVALQRISTLEVLLYLATDKAVAKPTSCAAVVESSLGWATKLVTMAMMSKSGDQLCPAVLKLSEYKTKMKRATIYNSDPFYTHNKGYKMCLCVYVAGVADGKGTHLSVFLCLMKGPHDDELAWPLREEFEIKLLNQISNSNHHSKILAYDDEITGQSDKRATKGSKGHSSWGKPRYISNEDLHRIIPRCQFLKDDLLFFQVTKL